jgi:hypothetical protein
MQFSLLYLPVPQINIKFVNPLRVSPHELYYFNIFLQFLQGSQDLYNITL